MNTEYLLPLHPVDAIRDGMTRIPQVWESSEQKEAVEKVVRNAIPPPRVRELRQAARILFVTRIIDGTCYRLVFRYLARTRDSFGACEQVTQMRYPIYVAIVRLYREGRKHGRQATPAVQLFVALARRTVFRSRFNAELHYRHIMYFRDTCLDYWRMSGEAAPSDCREFKSRLQAFIETCCADDGLGENNRKKYSHTALCLRGELRFGGRKSRGSINRKRVRRIGGQVRLAPAHLTSELRTVHTMSARATEVATEETGQAYQVQYPEGSTHRDRHRIDRAIRSGFARTNVRTTADMNACSLSTHRAFLVFADRHCDQGTFALVWVTAFLGLNHLRPIVEKRPGRDHPVDDQILVCPKRNVIVYNILRRRGRTSKDAFETCGRMTVPVGKPVGSGLSDLARYGRQAQSVDAVKRLARKFTRQSPGLNPTLRRLRAGSWTYMLRAGLTELELAALRGRVPPAFLAISAYYPSTVAKVFDRFRYAYGIAVSHWQLPDSFRFEFGRLPSASGDQIYCKPSRGLAYVEDLLGSIGEHYRTLVDAIRQERSALQVDQLVNALNAHELACYALQEFGVGLRPIGTVGDASLPGAGVGALTVDKSSRLFAERSYSPISPVHEKLLDVRRANRSFAEKVLVDESVLVKLTEPTSDLAVLFRYDRKRSLIVGRRLHGKDFRQLAMKLPKPVRIDSKANQLRHVSTEQMGDGMARWQSDEHHGHKVIGREPFGAWSTVSVADLRPLADRLECLHDKVVPKSLLDPLAPFDTRQLRGRSRWY